MNVKLLFFLRLGGHCCRRYSLCAEKRWHVYDAKSLSALLPDFAIQQVTLINEVVDFLTSEDNLGLNGPCPAFAWISAWISSNIMENHASKDTSDNDIDGSKDKSSRKFLEGHPK